MAVTYTAEQKAFAEGRGWKLATLAVPGWEFQGPVSPEQAREIEAFVTGFVLRRSAAMKAERTTNEKPS